MMVAIEEPTMAFRSISDDDVPEEEREIVGAGSIAEPDLADKKLGIEDDPLDPDAESLEDKIEDELDDDDDENEM